MQRTLITHVMYIRRSRSSHSIWRGAGRARVASRPRPSSSAAILASTSGRCDTRYLPQAHHLYIGHHKGKGRRSLRLDLGISCTRRLPQKIALARPTSSQPLLPCHRATRTCPFEHLKPYKVHPGCPVQALIYCTRSGCYPASWYAVQGQARQPLPRPGEPHSAKAIVCALVSVPLTETLKPNPTPE